MSKQTEVLKLALEALKQIDEAMPFPVAKLAQKVIREALAEQPAQQEPVFWAISYDGKTPYALWPDGDGALFDLEIRRQGGTASKMPLYTKEQL